MKTLPWIAALGATLMMTHLAFAASAVAKACAADIKAQCADVKRKAAIPACLKAHAADLSDSCKTAMGKADAGDK